VKWGNAHSEKDNNGDARLEVEETEHGRNGRGLSCRLRVSFMGAE
jgi:hypothetical protein